MAEILLRRPANCSSFNLAVRQPLNVKHFDIKQIFKTTSYAYIYVHFLNTWSVKFFVTVCGISEMLHLIPFVGKINQTKDKL